MFLTHRYVHNNKLTSLNGLERVPTLTTINAASNRLQSLDGVQHCAGLGSLHAGGNGFDSLAAIAVLACCMALTTLDLQENCISDADGLLELLKVTLEPLKVTLEPCTEH